MTRLGCVGHLERPKATFYVFLVEYCLHKWWQYSRRWNGCVCQGADKDLELHSAVISDTSNPGSATTFAVVNIHSNIVSKLIGRLATKKALHGLQDRVSLVGYVAC